MLCMCWWIWFLNFARLLSIRMDFTKRHCSELSGPLHGTVTWVSHLCCPWQHVKHGNVAFKRQFVFRLSFVNKIKIIKMSRQSFELGLLLACYLFFISKQLVTVTYTHPAMVIHSLTSTLFPSCPSLAGIWHNTYSAMELLCCLCFLYSLPFLSVSLCSILQ